jgi:AcrR family transcriptional regulator
VTQIGVTGDRHSVAAERGHKVLRHLGADDRSSTRVRIVDATLACMARQGSGKTTVDDIAREAGFSRATLYRTFPGGKDAVVAAVVETEVARLFSSLAVVMGEATDLEDVLVAGMVEAARRLSDHDALAYLVLHEPDVILPRLIFADMDRILFIAGDFAAPFFARWLSPDQASRAAEWAVRIVLAYLADPAPATDLSDPEDTRALVRTFVMPGILALRSADPISHSTSTPSASSIRVDQITNAKKGAVP